MNSQNLTLNDKTFLIPEPSIAEEPARDNPDVTLNLGGMGCPLLGLKSMMALRALEPGRTIEITTTGTDARKTLGRVSWMTGTQLIAVHQQNGQFKHLLRRA